MKLVNSQVEKDLAAGKPLRLDLGSGGRGPEGYYSVDHLPLEGVDIVADLNAPLTLLPDECVEAIRSNHALEHVANLLPLMREIHRITRPGGTITLTVPHFSNVYGYSDPTHVRFFGLYTMYYFVARENQPGRRKVPAFYTDFRFHVDSVRIVFYQRGFIDKLLVPLVSRLVNLNHSWQDFYERRLAFLFHAREIRYVLRPDK
jgi:predicted SAM-dependent methyltransferase